jgi:Ni/Co efflux regulator RcnB
MNPNRLVSLLAVLSFVVLSMAAPCYAQETQRQKQEQNPQQNQYRDELQSTAQQQDQQNVRTFAGKISQKNSRFFLEEAIHRTPYLLADTWNVKRFLGKKVRVTGTLDQDHNILHVKSIDTVP